MFDLGGGLFDVSVLEVGDTQLDGEDWDAVLTEYVADEFEKTQSIDLRKDRQALQRLKEAAEKAKIELSPMLETEVNLPFCTVTDAQTAVDILVFQTERPMTVDNMTLGKFRLEGLPSAPRGAPQIEVRFDLDANGILNTTAKDKATSREQKITITASTNVNKADVERMVQDAQHSASEDNRRREKENGYFDQNGTRAVNAKGTAMVCFNLYADPSYWEGGSARSDTAEKPAQRG